ncbi:DEAD/DEAH box helicase [Nocardia noduli]|uniref:DEAD/DEAH box helicase n=1 Tax=Nocardia noduli TaxID=2815722 RepID=UPI001C21D763|nr:DEAD/DEAH box helicase [Nocardia noduli]
MERALSIELLAGALGERSGLPTPDELQELLAQVEAQLILRRVEIDSQLLAAAWYLHGVASVNEARERYSLFRQRQAFQVSAHIFDLALNIDAWPAEQRLSFGFAAAIGYRRGGLDPNATAILSRLRADIHIDIDPTGHLETLSLEVGLAFLGFETKTLFRWLARWRIQMEEIRRPLEVTDLTGTVFGPTQMLIIGVEDLLYYFARGYPSRLRRGRQRLRSVAMGEAGPGDLNARWVASHLLRFSDEAARGSLWGPDVLPPSVPTLVREAFTVGTPPVLTLWEPQRELLNGTRSPFDPSIRRMVLSVPTSGGKTLVAQLIAVDHLSRTDRSVCYIVPTRSLGREVRRAMSNRIRILQKESDSDQPDFPFSFEDILFGLQSSPPADVEVMTPERLGHLIRHDVDGVLERFGMFIFDEAQSIKDPGRGFALESVISLLNKLTNETDHKIVLISAAMGNAGEIAHWLSPGGNALLHRSEWRGPRRLHAVYTTDAQWNTTQIIGNAGRTWPFRHTTDLTGLIRIRMANGRTVKLYANNTDWKLVRKSKNGYAYARDLEKDSAKSTKNYVIASQMITRLGHAGSVLVVAGTRKQAQQLAIALADELDDRPEMAPLVDFVRQQIGDNHPLVHTLRRGVGFHHAGLPIEVLEELEEAVRCDLVAYLTCTSTLTDGVNLPVRTVVIYDQPYPGQSEDSRLSGARLVNAMGRAGRAGRETEGWIVLVRAAEPSDSDFSDLNPDAETLAVTSSLVRDSALEAVARLEEECRASEDAIFEAVDEVSDFISFVWLVISIGEGRGEDPRSVNIDGIVASTLAAENSQSAFDAYKKIGYVVHRRYLASETGSRRRWSRTGTTIKSARIIDSLAERISNTIQAGAVEDGIDFRNPSVAIRSFSYMFGELLALSEASEWRFRATVKGADLPVDLTSLLDDWISGRSLPDLAEDYLAGAPDPSWRIEQMVDAVTGHFQHYLSWTIGAVVELVNLRLVDAECQLLLCPELSGFIRYGINTTVELLLMTYGVRSRRLAHAIGWSIPLEIEPAYEDIRYFLAQMTISEWRQNYGASSSEILDILEFTRIRRRSLLKVLLETGQVAIELPNVVKDALNNGARLSISPALDEPEPRPLAVFSGIEQVADISSQDHTDVQAILDTGLSFDIKLDDDGSTLLISLPLSED